MGFEPVYVYPDQVIAALDIKPTAALSAEVLRACRSGSRAVESLVHRFLYPSTRTISFDWPNASTRYSRPRRVDFDAWALIAPTSVTSGGVTITSGQYFLEPNAYGPPYEHLDIDRNTSAAFSGGPQHAVLVTGLWGWTNDEQTVGTLVTTITSADAFITTSGPSCVGAILRMGTERLQVLDTQWVSSTQTASALTSDKSSVTITVANGAAFTANERILIDSERMRIVDISGNTLTVARAIEGSVLAVHTLSTAIFWQHRLSVERGSLGTTAAAATSGATVTQWIPPSLANELAQAYAEDAFLQRNSGYSRAIGSVESAQKANLHGLAQLEERARRQFKRLRYGAV